MIFFSPADEQVFKEQLIDSLKENNYGKVQL